MYPDTRSIIHRQAGFALVTAIFLVVVLAALGAFIAVVFSFSNSAQTMDIVGVRGYQAARAGIEWGTFQSLRPPNTCSATTTLNFPATSLADFTTTVTCTRFTANEAGATVTVDQITATACNQPPCPSASPGPNYVERQLQAVVGN
jgi:MSHA biogenesis protein MshP